MRLCVAVTARGAGRAEAADQASRSVGPAVYPFSICRMDALACGGGRGRAAALARRTRVAAGTAAAGADDPVRGRPAEGAAACNRRTRSTRSPRRTGGYTALSIGFAAIVLALACADMTPAPARWARRCDPRGCGASGSTATRCTCCTCRCMGSWGCPCCSRGAGPSRRHLAPAAAYIARSAPRCRFGACALSYHLFEVHFAASSAPRARDVGRTRRPGPPPPERPERGSAEVVPPTAEPAATAVLAAPSRPTYRLQPPARAALFGEQFQASSAGSADGGRCKAWCTRRGSCGIS